jgi:hypothetical protein
MEFLFAIQTRSITIKHLELECGSLKEEKETKGRCNNHIMDKNV